MKDQPTSAGEWRTIVEPRTGERITFETSSAESGGEFVRAMGRIPAHTVGPQPHRHRGYTESFTVLAGRLTLLVGRRSVTLGVGETITVPAGVAHTFRNDGDEVAEVVSIVRPAAHFEESLRALYGLSRDGRMGPINFALAARLGGSVPAGMPVPVARALVSALAWIGDRLGRDGTFPEYTQPPTLPSGSA